ncbi:MAG: hypothetical protein JWP89_3915 [Schlesneria sp.]|nr:hypothetical protein [Schlesneria sp.]
MIVRSRWFSVGLALALTYGITAAVCAAGSSSAPADSNTVAAEVDRLILTDLRHSGVTPVDRCNDADFLRRTTLDITGQLPSPRDVTIFSLDPEANKREELIEQLLRSPEYGKNWARYWRDVVYMPATDIRARIAQADFEHWMALRLSSGVGWDRIVTSMLTATGDVREHPETALLIAQGGQSEEIAAEACRIFLGIQMQCANCHDHPSDVWKRNQFHELAAYFPRIAVRQTQQPLAFEIASVNADRGRGDFMRENPEQFVRFNDRNGDGKITKEEMRNRASMLPGNGIPAQLVDRIFEQGDSNKDDALTAEEIKSMPVPNQARRGSTEHYMPDLNDPASKGKLIQPKFFVDDSSPGRGLSDEGRRAAVANAFTSRKNPWFARAIVNRVWAEFLGEGFYMPIDDMGPTRTARFPEAIDALAKGFVSNDHDIRWLVRTIAMTQTYQRKVAAKPVAEDALPFAAVTPTRLRADLVFNSLFQILGINENSNEGREAMGGPRAYQREPRFQFDFLFGVDPSVPKDDITGNVPQSLYLMNSNALRAALTANNNTRLGKILRENKREGDALGELYLLVLAREPSKHEIEICQTYIKDVGQRGEAYEDLMWSLLNSSEFLSKR